METTQELDFERIKADIADKKAKMKKMDLIEKDIKELQVLEAKVAHLKLKISKLNDEIKA